MKLNIAICDDSVQDCEKIYNLIHTYAINYAFSIQISTFSSGEDFLVAQKDHPFDIVFMDVFLTGITGTETIAACASDSLQTVFTTTSQEYAIEAFNLHACHYLVKPVTYEAISDAMKRCLLSRNIQNFKCLEIKTSQGMVSVPMKQIVYIEVFNKICQIHTEKNSFQTYSSLDSMFEHLDSKDFMRAQRNFIVNMNYIESFYFDHIVLSNGIEIVLSRNTRSELKQQYQQFLFRLARRGVEI